MFPHPIHISKSAIAALTLPLAPSAIWRVMVMGAPGEECRENLVFRGLEPGRLEPGLDPLGQAGYIKIGGAGERIAGFHPVEVGDRGQQVELVGTAAAQD